MGRTRVNTPPVAEVRPRSSKLHQYFGGSSLWLLTLLCLLVSAGLIWWSMPTRGRLITIQFPEGHGLQPEDTVRYRGIEVGTVESVELNESLGSVEVEVLLKPSATELATEGTRFWIVRPELSLTRISGLETAIGHKYIGVSPRPEGEPAESAWHFQGLADVPVDTLADSGIELILEGEKRFGVSKGSAVTFRGVEVGTVLDVALAQDGRLVHIRIRIFDKFRDLLTSKTLFWATSGIDFDFNIGLNGSNFDLDTESLDTLFRGGVSMITPAQGHPVSPGDVFKLHATAEDDWLENANSFTPTSITFKGAVPVRVKWNPGGLKGYLGDKQNQCNGVAALDGGKRLIGFPTDLIQEIVSEKKFSLSVASGNYTSEDFKDSIFEAPMIWIETDEEVASFDLGSDLAIFDIPTECFAVRRGEERDSFFHLSINAESIKTSKDEQYFDVINFNGDKAVWHGAPVVTADDGQLVGVLMIEDRQTRILKAKSLLNRESK